MVEARARVIGLGQPAAGDDGVGPAVLDALAAMPLPAGTQLCRAREASALMELLSGPELVVIVDAIVHAGAPGTLHVLRQEQLAGGAMSGVSSHGVGIVQALQLARLTADDVAEEVCFVAVSIDAPDRYQHGLSNEVAHAVPRAAQAVAALLQKSEQQVRDGQQAISAMTSNKPPA